MAESAITLVDPATGARYAAADDGSVVLSNARSDWAADFLLEVHRMAPHEYDEHVLVGHRLIVNLGEPVAFGWKQGDRVREAMLPTGSLCLQSEGDTNAPFWSSEMTFAAIAIAPHLVELLLEDRAPQPDQTFAERRCLPDSPAYGYVRALCAELSSPTEPLYAEALSRAFVLHLLQAHGIAAGRKRLTARGKLGPAQLRAALDMIHDRLADGLSLADLSAAAGYSPFQFARMFKATTGLAPHGFVLQTRIERARRLLAADGRSPAEVALACGFYDQAHLTNTFRKVLGHTPAAYARSRR